MVIKAVETQVRLKRNLFSSSRITYSCTIVRFVGTITENTRLRFGGVRWRFEL
jgi:hypothetical protein